MTSPGSRLLARRLNYPFRHEEPISQSHGFVEELVNENGLREVFENTLGRVADLERLLSRAAQRGLDMRHLIWLRDSLQVIVSLKGQIMPFGQQAPLLLEKIVTETPADVLRPLLEVLNQALLDDAPPPEKGSVVFRTGFSLEWDECVALETSLETKLAELEAFERERSQIPNLKIGYTRVFGYYFEISKGKLSQVPEHFTRKQTLSTGERFVTPELKDLEEKALSASDNRLALEKVLLENLRQEVLNASEGLVSAARLTAELDVTLCFAKLANDHRWARPTIISASATKLLGSVHPVLAANHKGSSVGGPQGFVENDIILTKDQPLHLVTGPNMAGKSTLMRQVVLAQVLCQMGSFVPAKQAELGLCDRVLTRIGSGDHQLRGQSTFMVEMMETAHILRMATSKSLMVFDEIGRGTSTFDGLSLAWSILEYLHDHIGARTLFSTHYHELCEICPTRPKIVPMHMAVGEETSAGAGGQSVRHILFTHKYKPGRAGRSYGIHVAELAGLPPSIVERAQEVLERLERGEPKKKTKPKRGAGDVPTLF
jgi:DNA mismatch repair protein MutS